MIDWEGLGNRFPSALVRECLRLSRMGGNMVVTASEVAQRAGESEELAALALHEMVTAGLAIEGERRRCERCGVALLSQAPLEGCSGGLDHIVVASPVFRFALPES